MKYNLFVLLTLFVIVHTQHNKTIDQHNPNSQLSITSYKQNLTSSSELLLQTANNKPVALLNSLQIQSPKKQEISKDIEDLEHKEQNKVNIDSQLKAQKKQKLKKKEQESIKNTSNKESQVEAEKQIKKQNSKQTKYLQPSDNEIKIIPLTAQYGKQKSKGQTKQSTSQKLKSTKENNEQEQVQSQEQLLAEKIKGKNKQTQNPEATNQFKIIDKLIEEVKNNKDQLHEQSKQEIIQYLENKKQSSHLRHQTQKPQNEMLQSKEAEEATLEHSKQYVLITDQVIQVNQKSKQTKQMDNSTILVIMALTFIISIPIVREIRSRNDSQKEKHCKDSDTTLVTSKQDVQKSEGQKYYNQINNQSPYEIGEEMI